MHSEQFHFSGRQGQRLVGRLDLPDGSPQAYAVFAHCFACTKNAVAAVHIARALTLRGFGVLRFDFTGLGDSSGRFEGAHFSASVQDLHAAIAQLSDQGRRPSLLIGHSLGGAAALAAAADAPAIQAVAVIGAPFDAAHVLELFANQREQLERDGHAEVDLGGQPFLLDRRFVDDLQSQDQAQRIGGLRRPLLILHAPEDRIVPLEHAGQIFKAARHPKSFVSLDGADHLLSRRDDADYAAELIAAWASRYLATQAQRTAAMADGLVQVEETGAGRYQVEVRSGDARFLADEPVDAGGLGSGPSPYQLLSAALGACTAMTARMYADRKGWPLQRVRVRVGHEKLAERTPGDRFTRAVAFEGELDETQRLRLLEIVNKCPVHRSLESGAEVQTQLGDDRAAAVPSEPPSSHAQAMQTHARDPSPRGQTRLS